jgi:pimeloyl-ACP methyl ester carboxylesterase
MVLKSMPTWIFLRGLTRESRHWGDFVGRFQNELPSHPVLTLDLPGNGVFNHKSSPSRVIDMVQACRAELAQQLVAPPFYLLALSLGGMVAVAWAQAYPQEVAAQVLINTSMRPFNPFYRRLRPSTYSALLKLILGGASPLQWERAVLNMTSRTRDESVLPLWIALRQANPVSKTNALRQLVAAALFRAPAVLPIAATLILASDHDQLVSAQCSKVMAHQWRCALRVHPSAGHDLPLDDGAWVAQQVAQWVATSVSDATSFKCN